MNARASMAGAALILAVLLVPAASGSAGSDTRIFEAKLKMQFSQAFELRDSGGVTFAFQQNIKAKTRKHISGLPGWFEDRYGDLAGTNEELNQGLRIVVFDTRASYNGAFSTSGLFGHYHVTGKTVFTYQGSGNGTFFHELAHHYNRIVFGKSVPLWFDEGLASYFEKPVKGKFGCTNWRLPSLKKAVKKGGLMELERVLKGETSDTSSFLAQIRHFFVYLDYLGVLEGFLAGVRESKSFDVKEELEALTGMSLEEMDDDFRARVSTWEKNECVGRAWQDASLWAPGGRIQGTSVKAAMHIPWNAAQAPAHL
jgi:hypothetical protein